MKAEASLNSTLGELNEKLNTLTEMLETITEHQSRRPEIDLKARYTLKEASNYLKVSQTTLSRRAKEGKFVIIHDGSKPFVMGAEIVRYAREGGKRRIGIRRKKGISRRAKWLDS